MNKIGMRDPEKSFFSKLLIRSNMAIITTSANTKGKKAPNCYLEVEKEVLDFVDLAIDGKCTKYKQGSTVIEITENKVKILR